MTSITFISGITKYFWNGRVNAVISSLERVTNGTRCIYGEWFFCIQSKVSPSCLDWTPVDESKNNMEWVREFKKKVVGL